MSIRQEFIQQAKAEAGAARSNGAPIVVGIAVAQAALESCYGQSRLAIEANNLFGIKATKSWTGPTVIFGTKEQDSEGNETVVPHVSWRKYASWEECFHNYGQIISRTPWFADAANAARVNDAKGFLSGLLPGPNGEPGWATDVAYAEKVMRIAKDWRLV